MADFKLKFGPVSVRWIALNSEVTEQSGFVDMQTKVPFQVWRHHHKFRAIDEQTTEVIDEIEAEYGSAISRFMWLILPVLFAYRAWQTKKKLETENKKQSAQKTKRTETETLKLV
jgi:ligand-binding SRPBCC domain-containing protein